MVRSSDYRVNFRDGNETTACYTDNLEDAVKTAIEMARKRVPSAAAHRVGRWHPPELEGIAEPVALAA
jgi:hypothetical protein